MKKTPEQISYNMRQVKNKDGEEEYDTERMCQESSGNLIWLLSARRWPCSVTVSFGTDTIGRTNKKR